MSRGQFVTMVKLPTKEDRNNLNIDTWERAILYSAMLLYNGVRDANFDQTFQNEVTITAPNNNTNQFNVTVNVTLPIDNVEAVELGGNVVESVGEYNQSEPLVTLQCDSSSSEFIALAGIEPSFTVNVEFYFIWLLHRVKANLIEDLPDEASRINSQVFLDNPNFPQVRLSVNLPVDNVCYLRGDNLLCCLKPLVTTTVSLGNIGQQDEQEKSTVLDNSTIMNNEFILGNSSSGSEPDNNTFDNTLTLNNNVILENN